MGGTSTKLDRKGLISLFISLNESCDGLMHELSLITSDVIKKALENNEYREHSFMSDREIAFNHNCTSQRQGLILKISNYKDTRYASDLLKNFIGYTSA